MDKRSKTAALAIVIVATAGLIAWHIRSHRPPTYQGKTAAKWFAEFSAAEPRYRYKLQTGPVYRQQSPYVLASATIFSTDVKGWLGDPAADGLRGLGTNAALYLKGEFLRREPFWAPKYRKTFYKLPKGIQSVVPNPPEARPFVWNRIFHALQALGTNAVPAVPALIDKYADSDPFARSLITEALSHLAYTPEALDWALERAVQKAQFSLAVDLIGKLNLRTPKACTILANVVVAGDLAMKQRAIGQLTYIGPSASLAVPALISALTNADKELRYSAASALAEIGLAAQSAAPALAPLTNDVSELVQHAARRALFAISNDPARKPE